MRKVFVEVTASFSMEGKITPVSFVWDDGRTFEIDRILDARQAASLKAGGFGMRYTIRVRGKQTFLFYDGWDHTWFMEGLD